MLICVEASGARLDVFLAKTNADLTRSRIQKLISDGNITVNGSTAKANYKLREGDRIELTLPPPKDTELKAEEIPLDIVYEDEHMLVVNKPQGMVVHPAAGNLEGTLVNALMAHCGDNLSGINGEIRPGIIHRIDKDTSGLLLVAKDDRAHLGLSEQIKEHSLTREYMALVHGRIKEDSGTIDAPIGRDPKDRKKMTITEKNSRDAVTHFYVLERFDKYTLVRCRLETGRTHQIRVHMSQNGHPIVGDPVYGRKKEEFKLSGQLLHARKVGYIHPVLGEYMEFEREAPDYFEEVLTKLRRREQ
ncbi:MAG: RluA family pseudouridine synthase [Ruminococcaceae bacterium]|nr:RluA family pseudouridine synthase [Oscillospiraceae bacterium]